MSPEPSPRGGPPAFSGYDAARRAKAFLPLPERGVLEAKGPDRVKFLQAMLSNDVAGLAAGQSRLSALLTVKGHVQTLLRVVATPQALLLEMPRDRLATVEATLQHYRVAAPVRFQAQALRVVGVLGPEAGALKAVEEALTDRPPIQAEAHDLPAGGRVLYVPPEDEPRVEEALVASGALPMDRAAFDALRVEEGRPWFGVDVTEESLLHETGFLLEYASLTKGCYLGQEVVARLEGRGANVSKALRGLRLESAVAAGAMVTADGAEVGRVTTAAVSPELGPVAMASLRRSHLEPGTAVAVGGIAGTVALLPLRKAV
jgi:folate-binding protein YgfZ